MDES